MDAKSEIEAFIRSEFSTSLGCLKLQDDTQLIEAGIVDSLGIMKLLQFLEERLAIHVADDDLRPENFASLSAIAAFVKARMPSS